MRKMKISGRVVTTFGRHPSRTMKSLAAEAVTGALDDAGIAARDSGGAWNATTPAMLGHGCRTAIWLTARDSMYYYMKDLLMNSTQ